MNGSLPDECEPSGLCEYDMPSIDSVKDEHKTIIASANEPMWVSAYYVKSRKEGQVAIGQHAAWCQVNISPVRENCHTDTT